MDSNGMDDARDIVVQRAVNYYMARAEADALMYALCTTRKESVSLADTMKRASTADQMAAKEYDRMREAVNHLIELELADEPEDEF